MLGIARGGAAEPGDGLFAARDVVAAFDERRRRLVPMRSSASSSWSSSPPSLGPCWLPMDRPPGRLLGGTVGGGGMGPPDWRARGAPTGIDDGSVPWGALRQAWIRFLPSGWVTRGCNFAVVKVYTSPVSDTTSKRTWVPVSVDNS